MKHLLTTAALSLFALPLQAATVSSFVPGSSPCAGVCTQEWAAELSGAPMGQPEPVTIYPGDTIVWMSYGRDGEPHGSAVSQFVGTEEPLTGVGYRFMDGDTEKLFVRIDACQNWAIVIVGSNVGPVPGAPSETVYPPSASSITTSTFALFTPSSPDPYVPLVPWDPEDPITPIDPWDPEDPTVPYLPPVSEVPLPNPGLMLLTALFGLTMYQRRKS